MDARINSRERESKGNSDGGRRGYRYVKRTKCTVDARKMRDKYMVELQMHNDKHGDTGD